MRVINNDPVFEVVVDSDGAISEVFYGDTKLSDILPTIFKVDVGIDCSESPNYIDLRCAGEVKITYKDVRRIRRRKH